MAPARDVRAQPQLCRLLPLPTSGGRLPSAAFQSLCHPPRRLKPATHVGLEQLAFYTSLSGCGGRNRAQDCGLVVVPGSFATGPSWTLGLALPLRAFAWYLQNGFPLLQL